MSSDGARRGACTWEGWSICPHPQLRRIGNLEPRRAGRTRTHSTSKISIVRAQLSALQIKIKTVRAPACPSPPGCGAQILLDYASCAIVVMWYGTSELARFSTDGEDGLCVDVPLCRSPHHTSLNHILPWCPHAAPKVEYHQLYGIGTGSGPTPLSCSSTAGFLSGKQYATVTHCS